MVRIAEAALINLLSKSKLHTMMYRCTGLMKRRYSRRSRQNRIDSGYEFWQGNCKGYKKRLLSARQSGFKDCAILMKSKMAHQSLIELAIAL